MKRAAFPRKDRAAASAPASEEDADGFRGTMLTVDGGRWAA
jgi:hypothetical protein